jgi:hypothetical protein
MTQLTLNQFLQQDSKMLGSLLTKLNQLKQWNTWLKESLTADEPLTKHCYIVNLKGTSLIVIADSAHWVTRLRFHVPDLLKKLKKYPGLETIRAICSKTQPNPTMIIKKKKKTPQTLSAKTAELFLQSAQKITDKKLRDSLEKIARHALTDTHYIGAK